jgi:hypothetical protein
MLAPIAMFCVSPLIGAERAHYASCTKSPDPPSCLVQLASTHGDPASSDFLEAVISTGSLELIERNSGSLVVGAKAAATSANKFLAALAINGVRAPSEKQVIASSDSILLAAVALAAAAQRQREPFDNRS